jgi:hypothetical protein
MDKKYKCNMRVINYLKKVYYLFLIRMQYNVVFECGAAAKELGTDRGQNAVVPVHSRYSSTH